MFTKLFEEQFWLYNTLTNDLLLKARQSLNMFDKEINNTTQKEINNKITFLIYELFKELKD